MQRQTAHGQPHKRKTWFKHYSGNTWEGWHTLFVKVGQVATMYVWVCKTHQLLLVWKNSALCRKLTSTKNASATISCFSTRYTISASKRVQPIFLEIFIPLYYKCLSIVLYAHKYAIICRLISITCPIPTIISKRAAEIHDCWMS